MPRYKLLIEYVAKEPFLPYDHIKLLKGEHFKIPLELLGKYLIGFADLDCFVDKNDNPIKGSIAHGYTKIQENP